MNHTITLAYAYKIMGDSSYKDYIMRTMNQVMGVNAMRISYFTGQAYEEFTETDEHDFWAWTIRKDSFWTKGYASPTLILMTRLYIYIYICERVLTNN